MPQASTAEMHKSYPVTAQRVIGPIAFEVVGRQEAIRQLLCAIRSRSCSIFAFCNMHTFNTARRMPALATAMSAATVFNDGLGIDLASWVLFGVAFPENLNGTDLTPELLASLDRPTSVFLVGSPPGVAEEAARVLERTFPVVSVVGSHHGFFSETESHEIIARIRSAGTDLLLVGMGNPRQEIWAAEIANQTGATILCVGAYLDFASGRIKRAPPMVRAMRIEWLYRLVREPVRMSRRYIGGAIPFFLSVLKEKFRGRRGASPI